MKYPILALGLPIAFFVCLDVLECNAQDNSITDKWYIQATTEYNMPIWISDFKEFIDAHQSNVADLSGVEIFGWEVGLPIWSDKGLKAIFEVLTSQNSALSDRSIDASLRYNFAQRPQRISFSSDIGFGHQSYLFNFCGVSCSSISLLDDTQVISIEDVTPYSLTQRLWNVHTAINAEIKLSKHIFLAIALKYRFLFANRTFISRTHNRVDDFPKLSNHDVAINCGLSYYFDKF